MKVTGLVMYSECNVQTGLLEILNHNKHSPQVLGPIYKLSYKHNGISIAASDD
jgi:hypothetical protein